MYLIGNEFEIMVQSNHPITITDNICFLTLKNPPDKTINNKFWAPPCSCETIFTVC